MNHLRHHRVRGALLAGTVVLTMGALYGATPAQALVPCTVSLGVSQSSTTVTGTPLADTINCSAATPGKTINGLAGDDTITGTAFSDRIDGGSGNDTITSGPAVSVGNDTVVGGVGNDTITGATGSDNLSVVQATTP